MSFNLYGPNIQSKGLTIISRRTESIKAMLLHLHLPGMANRNDDLYSKNGMCWYEPNTVNILWSLFRVLLLRSPGFERSSPQSLNWISRIFLQFWDLNWVWKWDKIINNKPLTHDDILPRRTDLLYPCVFVESNRAIPANNRWLWIRPDVSARHKVSVFTPC